LIFNNRETRKKKKVKPPMGIEHATPVFEANTCVIGCAKKNAEKYLKAITSTDVREQFDN